MDKLRFILLFAVVLLAGSAAAYDFESGGLYYNILDAEAKTVEVTLEGEKDGWDTKSSYSGDIVIPSTVRNGNETYSVKKIGQYAFCRSEITSLTIQNGVETIDDCAFLYSSQLVDVSLPSSLRFASISSLSTVSVTLDQIRTSSGRLIYPAKRLFSLNLPLVVNSSICCRLPKLRTKSSK